LAYELSRDQIARYAQLTHDRNPLHVDEGFAASSRFGGIIAHGFLLLGPVLEMLNRASGFPKSLECGFLAPGRPGDQLSCRLTGEDGPAGAGFEILNQASAIYVRGRLKWRPQA